jgi:hypothetical protein
LFCLLCSKIWHASYDSYVSQIISMWIPHVHHCAVSDTAQSRCVIGRLRATRTYVAMHGYSDLCAVAVRNMSLSNQLKDKW